MKVEYVSPFAEASVHVFDMLIGCKPERGALSARPQVFTSQQINIVCGITGLIEGLVIYGMSMTTADAIAAKMIGSPVSGFDQLAASAIAELGNMVSGHSASLLAAQGYTCDITPPTIIRGTNVSVTTLGIPALVIPMNVPQIGLFEINVSLKERAKLAA
jgi:chemotaxis protein CheX